MATANELMERGDKLAVKYTINELKNSLKNAISRRDGQERLALQWALKKKTGTKDGYSFTKEQEVKLSILSTKLTV